MKDHVALVIKNENNEVLFIQRSFSKKTLPGVWSFPSGTIEEGENLHDTTLREAKEELGVEVEIIKTIATKELPEFSVRLHFILCTIKNEKLRIMEPEEIHRIEWMKFEKFFHTFSDHEIGHGLVWLRQNQKMLSNSLNIEDDN